jgi:hypothetical protein
LWTVIALGFGGATVFFWFTGSANCHPQHEGENQPFHNINTVTQKYLTMRYYRNTLINMANVLNADKQIAIISALAEGSSIRSIERITGVHRDTIIAIAQEFRNLGTAEES